MHVDPVRSSSCMLILYRLLDSVRKIKADGGSEGVESEKTVDSSGYKEKAESRMKFYDDSKKTSDRSGSQGDDDCSVSSAVLSFPSD